MKSVNKETLTERIESLQLAQECVGLSMNEEYMLIAYRMLLSTMDSEPVAYIFKHPAGRLFWSLTDKSNKGHDDVMPVYASPQPAPIVEREPIAWLNDTYLARGVVDGEAGSEDAGPGYIPVYRHAQPAPVVPDELLKEYLRLVDCMLSDYRNGNYGDAQRWIGHIVEASDAFEEKHGLSPWEMARKNCRAAMLNQK